MCCSILYRSNSVVNAVVKSKIVTDICNMPDCPYSDEEVKGVCTPESVFTASLINFVYLSSTCSCSTKKI